MQRHSVRWLSTTGHCREGTRPVWQEVIVLPASVGLPRDGPSYR